MKLTEGQRRVLSTVARYPLSDSFEVAEYCREARGSAWAGPILRRLHHIGLLSRTEGRATINNAYAWHITLAGRAALGRDGDG